MSQNTIISYMNDIKSFLKEMNLESNDYVTAADIRKWVNEMLTPTEGKTLAVSTINRRLNSLRSYYAWAVKNNRLQQNPMLDIRDLKSADDDSEKIMWLTEDEFEDLLYIIRKKPVNSRGVNPEEKYRRDRAIIYLFTYAGLRVDELSNLKINDIDLEMKRIRIVGKGMKVRSVPISNVLLAEIKDWFAFREEMAKKKPHVEESPYVFYSQRSPKFTEPWQPHSREIFPAIIVITETRYQIESSNIKFFQVQHINQLMNLFKPKQEPLKIKFN